MIEEMVFSGGDLAVAIKNSGLCFSAAEVAWEENLNC
jgi:hypothetical protein